AAPPPPPSMPPPAPSSSAPEPPRSSLPTMRLGSEDAIEVEENESTERMAPIEEPVASQSRSNAMHAEPTAPLPEPTASARPSPPEPMAAALQRAPDQSSPTGAGSLGTTKPPDASRGNLKQSLLGAGVGLVVVCVFAWFVLSDPPEPPPTTPTETPSAAAAAP